MAFSNILVTGGAGFIGSHLVDHYLAQGCKVTVIDDLSTGARESLNQHKQNANLTLHVSKLQNLPELANVVKNCDLILHFAAAVGVKRVLEDPLNVLDSNVHATRLLLDTTTRHNPKARVLIASSSEVYGLNPNVPFEEMDDLHLPSRDPVRWCYAVTKLADEMYSFAYHHTSGLNVTSLRLFNTSGNRQSSQYGMVIPNFVKFALKNEDIVVFGDGEQTRSFCDVRDVVNGVSLIAEANNAAGTVVNVGNDRELTMNQLANTVIEVTGSRSKIRHISYKEAYGQDFVDVARRKPDLSLIKSLTGYMPQWSLEDTIRSVAGL